MIERIHAIKNDHKSTYCGISLPTKPDIKVSQSVVEINCFKCKDIMRGEIIEEDLINHPSHYGKLPNGIECIDVASHFNFNLGNAIKYIWRTGKKVNTDPVEDLKKAMKYLEFETHRITEHG